MKHLFTPLLLITAAAFSSAAVAIEKPEYEILHVDGEVEYRLYQAFIVAETEILGVSSWKDASNEGFRRLFDYITGENSGQ